MKKLLLTIFIVTYGQNAFAYLDPGSASLIVQGLIAAVVSFVAAARIFKEKVKSLLGFKTKDSLSDDNLDQASDENTETLIPTNKNARR